MLMTKVFYFFYTYSRVLGEMNLTLKQYSSGVYKWDEGLITLW